MGKGVGIKGNWPRFANTIVPMATFSAGTPGCLFAIDGDLMIGGFAFRQKYENFIVDCSNVDKTTLPITFKLNKAYSIDFDSVYIHSGVGTAFDITTCNDITLRKPRVYGRSAVSTISNFGIRCNSGTVKMIAPDVELFFKGVSQEGSSKVDIISIYGERNIIGIEANGTSSGSLTVTGGSIESPGASGEAARILGPNSTWIGGRYNANGGRGLSLNAATTRPANTHIIGVSGDISDIKNWAYKRNTDTTSWYPTEAFKYDAAVADNVATNFFTIEVPNVFAYFGTAEVEINARDESGQSLWTGFYRFSFDNPAGTILVTPVLEYGKTSVNSSANYSLAITCAAVVAGTTLTFQVTANVGGALGEGTTSRISAKASVVHWDSTGAIYLQAV